LIGIDVTFSIGAPVGGIGGTGLDIALEGVSDTHAIHAFERVFRGTGVLGGAEGGVRDTTAIPALELVGLAGELYALIGVGDTRLILASELTFVADSCLSAVVVVSYTGAIWTGDERVDWDGQGGRGTVVSTDVVLTESLHWGAAGEGWAMVVFEFTIYA
jgi:hypothetical protein